MTSTIGPATGTPSMNCDVTCVSPMIGGGEMGRLVRETDWSTTPLGAYATWPQSLRSSLSLVLNAKGIAALYWGPDQWLLYNDAYGVALGERHPAAFGRPMPEVLTDIAPVLGPQVAHVLATGEGFAIENLAMTMRRHGRDEETVWTYSFTPVQGETGGFAGVLLLATEMTAQKQAERALRDAEGQLREQNVDLAQRAEASARERDRVWQHSKDLLGVADEWGIWLSVSPAWTRTLGWQPEDIVGRTSEWMEHPDDREKTRAEVARLAAGQTTFEFENRFRTEAGDYRTLAWTAVPDAGHLYCVARDITEERARASVLADAERVRLALAAGAIIGTWVWDMPTDRFTVDEAFATAFGLDPVLGREGIPLAQIVATVHPDDQAGLAEAIGEAVKRGGRYVHRYRVRRHDGQYHWLEANGHVEHGPDGTPLRFPGVLTDVSTRRFDLALGALNERLRTMDTPQEMAFAAAETVGSILDVSRVAYGDVDPAGRRIVVRPDWLAEGQPSIAGTHDFENYGSYVKDLLRGEDVIIDDVRTDPRTATQLESFEGIDVRALVNLPLMERGRLRVVFCLNQSRPRAWSADELSFARRVMDRTEVEISRRTAENELRTSEARQRSLLQRMPGFAAVFTGPEHVIDYVNDAYVAICGPRAYVGRRVRDVFPELEGQGFFEMLDRVYATGEPIAANGVPVRIAGEASDRFIDHVHQPIRGDDGNVIGIFVAGNEVTERHRSAIALRNLNADLERRVAERVLARGRTWLVSPDLLVVIGSDGVFEASNPAWTITLGWTEDELTRTAFTDFVHPDDLDITLAVWADAIERGIPSLRFENRYRHKDGTWHWLSWVAVPDDGKVYCSARDITAIKEQAGALLQAEEALRQSQKMEAIGQLTGGVAHDFNNLLTVIKSSSDLLKRSDLNEGRRLRYVGAISDTVDRAAKLTGQLLAFARRQALMPEVFAACDSVRAIADMIGTLAGSRIVIDLALPATKCFVMADPSQFDTALVNMTVNARDAMDGAGHLTLAVRLMGELPALRSHAAVPGPYAAISVTDTGTGIALDQIDRIFEPFFTTKEIGKGTGLGLSQVFGFAKQSGGDIAVHSIPGQGTTFTMYLPSVPAPEQATQPIEPATAIEGHGTRVLVVEDNVEVGTFAVQTLADLGYDTILAPGGSEALVELAKDPGRFDVVFSDVMMPGMSGIEMAQEIRRIHPGLPVVLTSGYSHVLAQNGTYGFELLHKPYSVEQLARMLRKAAAGRRRLPGA